MLDCFLDYSVNPNLRFHSRIDKIIDDVIREKINIPHKFRMRLESRHCVESRIIYFRFRVLDKACLQCNVFLKGLSEEMKEALSDERIDFAVIYEGIQGSQQDTDTDGGVMKRIDLAINDHTGILDIPELAEKCRKREYIGKSRSYKFYQSGELIKHREDDREYMGRTLYLGSLKSDVYFCIYEKDYEQYVKLGTPLEEADIINRFEIRLRNERAYYAVRDLLTYYDAEQTAFSIINQYVRFVDEEPDKRKNEWKLNDRWAWFIGDNRQSLKLTTKPEPYTLDRTLRWVQRQVAPTLKMLKKIDKGNGTDYMETIEQQAKLTEKHKMIIKQQTTPAKDLVES